MSNQEAYQHTVLMCLMAAKALRDLPVREILDDIRKAESVGPIMDPTLWREKAQALQEDKGLLEAALTLQEWARTNHPAEADEAPLVPVVDQDDIPTALLPSNTET